MSIVVNGTTYQQNADGTYNGQYPLGDKPAFPAAPSNLTASYLSDTSLSLSWTDNADNETNFELDRSPNGVDTWTPLIDPPANATSATDTGLTVDTTYYYRLRSVNASGNSSYVEANGTTTAVTGWTIDRSFNAGPVGNTTEGQADGFDSNAFGSVYSNEQSNGDGLVAKVQVRNGNTDFGYWGGTINFTENVNKGGELWLSFNYYIPASYSLLTDNNWLKFIRIASKYSGGGTAGYVECDMVASAASAPHNTKAFAMHKEGWSTVRTVGDVNTIPRDQWFNVELYVKANDENAPSSPTPGSGDGIMRLWIDGVLVGEEDMRTLENATDYYDAFYLGTYWNGGAPQDQHTYIDRVKITTTQPTNTDAGGNYIIGQTA